MSSTSPSAQQLQTHQVQSNANQPSSIDLFKSSLESDQAKQAVIQMNQKRELSMFVREKTFLFVRGERDWFNVYFKHPSKRENTVAAGPELIYSTNPVDVKNLRLYVNHFMEIFHATSINLRTSKLTTVSDVLNVADLLSGINISYIDIGKCGLKTTTMILSRFKGNQLYISLLRLTAKELRQNLDTPGLTAPERRQEYEDTFLGLLTSRCENLHIFVDRPDLQVISAKVLFSGWMSGAFPIKKIFKISMRFCNTDIVKEEVFANVVYVPTTRSQDELTEISEDGMGDSCEYFDVTNREGKKGTIGISNYWYKEFLIIAWD